MTVAIVSSILFCYRFFVTFFPSCRATCRRRVPNSPGYARSARRRRSLWTWASGGTAIAFSLGFIAPVQPGADPAYQATVQTVEESDAFKSEPRRARRTRGGHALPQRPEATRTTTAEQRRAQRQGRRLRARVVSPASNDGPPRGLRVCHHRQGMAEGDRVGLDLKELHEGWG